jgi:phospholipase C
MMMTLVRRTAALLALGLLCAAVGVVLAPRAMARANLHPGVVAAASATPIHHLVVIVEDGASFDHYFGTFPNATNTDGSPFPHNFRSTVNGLTPDLLHNNPNFFNPERLTRSQALTCAQNTSYLPEQEAFDGTKMDEFVQHTDQDVCTGQPIIFGQPGLGMDYFDGNTVTALWQYARRFAMSDNSYQTQFGPATPGSLNMISGQTHGAEGIDPATTDGVADPGVVASPDSAGVGTDVGNQDPAFDACSNRSGTAAGPELAMTGHNIGNMLDAAEVSWGWFQGGFAPTGTNASGAPVCGSTHQNVGGNSVTDYVPSEDPFQFYPSTANPLHLPPSNVGAIGEQIDQANHQYDTSDFFAALHAGNLPEVSFLKPPAYQDGHAASSDPLDQQTFLVNAINELQRSPAWRHTAIVISFADSGGWYDHVASPIVNPSADPAFDALSGAGVCGQGSPLGGFEDRCGFGPRLPLLVVSPWAKPGFVNRSLSDQASISTFIEDNWLGGLRIGGGSFDALGDTLNKMFTFKHANLTRKILDPTTGEPVGH